MASQDDGRDLDPTLIASLADRVREQAEFPPEELAELLDNLKRLQQPPATKSPTEGGGSRIVLLKLRATICRTLLSIADPHAALAECSRAIAETLRTASVAIYIDGICETPVSSSDSALVVKSVPIFDDIGAIGTLNVVGPFSFPRPVWLEDHVLQPFLEGVAEEVGQCAAQLRPKTDCEPAGESPLLESKSIGVIRINADWQVTGWSRAAGNILGWTEDDIVGRNISIIIDERDRPRFDERINEAFETARSSEMLLWARRWDDRKLPIHIEFIGSRTSDSVSLVLRDETEEVQLRRLSRALAAASEILTRSASISVAGDVWLREICTAMDWSRGELWLDRDPTTCELAGSWTSESISTEALEAAIAGSRESGDDDVLNRLREQKSVVRIEDLATTLTSRRAVAAWKCGLHDVIGIPVLIDGEFAGAALFYHASLPEMDRAGMRLLQAIAGEMSLFLRNEQLRKDVAEAETNVLQTRKMESMGRLAGGIVHDFNNLLTIIFGLSEIIADTLDEDAPQRDMVAEIEKACHRAAGLTQQILSFSRKQPLQSAVLNVNGRLESLRSMLGRLLDERIDLQITPTRKVHRVRFDPIQFEQVLLNLVVNARDAIDGSGTITVGLRDNALSVASSRLFPGGRSGEFVIVSVTDTGCGMDEGTRARVLEPFFTTKEQGRGTGMGLATVNGIVRDAGGFLSITSEPGQGTTIEVYLPRTSELPETIQGDQIPADRQQGDETILLVEEEDILRSLTTRMLEARGYTVWAAADAVQARKLLKQKRRRINLLITGESIAGEPSDELVDFARSTVKAIRVLLVANSINTDGRSGIPVLEKPYTSQSLGSEVHRVLDGDSNRQV